MRRIFWLKVMMGGMILVVLVRLFVVQIVEHGKWMELAEKQHVMQNVIVAPRGRILMMDEGKAVPVVMNQAVWTVAMDPAVVREERVREVLKREAGEYVVKDFEQGFLDKTRRYFVVAKNVPLRVIEKIREAELAGVWTQKGVRRVYAEGVLGSGLLGFVNAEGVGQYGVEGGFNKQLAGKNGLLKTVKDINSTPLSIGNDNVRVPAMKGEDVVLSIDRNVQFMVEKVLTEAVREVGADSASGVVMDPRDGRVMAMANVPNYDPGDFGRVKDASAYMNKVVEVPYEPASVCKAFVFAAGIEEGVLSPETRYVNRGKVVIDGWPIENAYKGMLGEITMQDALNYSLNTGSIEGLRLLGGGELNLAGRKKLHEYFVGKFGLGRATGVELAEAVGVISDPEKGDGRNSLYANMTFGQNLNVTMMQVVTGYAGMVNGGTRVQPSIVAQIGEKVKGGEGVVGGGGVAGGGGGARGAGRSGGVGGGRGGNGVGGVDVAGGGVGERILSEETSRKMRNMLFVTRRRARMRGVDRPGYFVGGKTGTAQVIREGRYVMDETVATYVGFGGKVTSGDRHAIGLKKERGVDGLPEYLIMVKIEGKGKKYGGEAHALPMFDKISNYMQDYLRIRP